MNPSTESTEKGIAILEKHDQWLTEHLDELIDQYPGKIVAILDGEVVAIGDSYKEVYAPFQNQGREWMPLAIRVPHPDDTQEFLL